MDLAYAVDQLDATVTVAPAGELDLATADELRGVLADAVARPDCRTVLVDLGGVTFLDSTTIGVLLGSQRAAHRAGRRLVVTHPRDAVLRVLTVAGVLDLLADKG